MKDIHNVKGFTLVELMIVIAIIGMIAAVGIPAYLDYLAKSQVTEGVSLISAARTPLSEFYSNNSTIPSVNEIGITTSGKYVADITIFSDATNVVIQATFKPTDVSFNITNQTIAVSSDRQMSVWECGLAGTNSSSFTSVEYKYLPAGCR